MTEATPTAVALEAAPQEQKEVSLREFKKLMGQFFTVRRDHVAACGHKFRPTEHPRYSNCEHCWFAYFQTNGEATALADEIFREKGKSALIQIQGEKYVKMFVRFMAGIALAAKSGRMSGTEENIANTPKTNSSDEGTEQKTPFEAVEN